MSKIVAIDFEAANKRSGSAISIGYAVIENNLITDYNSFLIKPHKDYSYFMPQAMKIHHITPDMVKNQPDFRELYYEKLEKILDNAFLIAHGAHWDVRVLKKLFKLYDIPYKKFKYCCTVDISTNLWPNLENHRLPTVSEALNFPLKDHHKAKYDAYACAKIYTGALQDLNANNPFDLCFMSKTKIGTLISLNETGWNEVKYFRPNLNSLYKMTDINFENHPFYHKNIAKIGDFTEMSIEDIGQHLINIDSNFHEYILKDTDLVVLSNKYFSNNLMPKFIKNLIYIAKSKFKPIISEEEFKNKLFSNGYCDNKTGLPKYDKSEYY